jgi:hypothetical protein
MSQQTVYPSLARTATPTAFTLDLSVSSGLVIVVDVTAKGTAPSVVLTVDGVDTASGQFWNLLTSAAIVAVTGSTPLVLRIGRGLPAAANLVANDIVPDRVRIKMTHGNSDSITYSVAAHILY